VQQVLLQQPQTVRQELQPPQNRQNIVSQQSSVQTTV